MSEPSTQIVDVVLGLEDSENESEWKTASAAKMGVQPDRITEIRLRKHSIDARQRQIKVQLRLEIGLDGQIPGNSQPTASYSTVEPNARRIIIVGCGPAGMFAALRCIELGAKPIILERGKDASARRFDLAPILRHGKVIEDSNYLFWRGRSWHFF